MGFSRNWYGWIFMSFYYKSEMDFVNHISGDFFGKKRCLGVRIRKRAFLQSGWRRGFLFFQKDSGVIFQTEDVKPQAGLTNGCWNEVLCRSRQSHSKLWVTGSPGGRSRNPTCRSQRLSIGVWLCGSGIMKIGAIGKPTASGGRPGYRISRFAWMSGAPFEDEGPYGRLSSPK